MDTGKSIDKFVYHKINHNIMSILTHVERFSTNSSIVSIMVQNKIEIPVRNSLRTIYRNGIG